MTIHPLQGCVLLQPIHNDEKTASGIYLPNTKDRTYKARVIAIGAGVEAVRENQVVLYKQYAANDFSIDHQKYEIVHEEDVLAIIEES